MPNHAGRSNPFQPAPGADPPALVGRGAELASIDDAAGRIAGRGAPTPIAFFGLRGLGKTVLLNAVRRRTPGGIHLHVEVETGVLLETSVRNALETLRSSVEPSRVRVRKSVDRALRFLPLPSFELPHDLGAIKFNAPEADELQSDLPLGRAIDALNVAVTSARSYLVITIDEIQDVDLPGLRSLVASVHQSASSKSPILLACAGLPEAERVFLKLRTYVKRWDRFELSYLTRAETAEAIRIPLSEAGVAIEDRALSMLVDECAGYPYFIQRFASAAWNRLAGDRISVDIVAEVIPQVRVLVEKLFYADEFRRLSPRERLFCKRLAELGPGPRELGDVAKAFGVPSSAISSIRTNLIRKGVIFSPSSGTIEFRMPLADRYVREHDLDSGATS